MKTILIIFSTAALFFTWKEPALAQSPRPDGAIRITYSTGGASCQNPVFSPDSYYLMFTRFKNGYNKGPSELVQVKIDGTGEMVVVSSPDSDNVNVPYGSWVDGQICWASDRAGGSEEIYRADEDGSNIERLTTHPESGGYYIEPVFNPLNTDKLLFEYGHSDSEPHHIRLLEIDRGGVITPLTDESAFDDRLPSWSPDGRKILFQRNPLSGEENWEIYTADIIPGSSPHLTNLKNVSRTASQDTDASWSYHNHYILSSSDYGGIPTPNIFAFPAAGGLPVRITSSTTDEDGAPSFSPDGRWIAFESHSGRDEESPSEIWLIAAPLLNYISRAGGRDYNGDGTADPAIFRPGSGLWAIRGLTHIYFGGPGDRPTAGDYDGDGTAGIAVFRGSSGLWAINGISRFYFGRESDLPVPGDYAGDGSARAGVFRDGLWAIRGLSRFYLGASGDLPAPGDWNGDNTLDPAVFRPSSGLWAIRNISRFYYGSAGDYPLTGDYSGRGSCSPAIFRAASGLWAVQGSSRYYFGISSDRPVPADYDGDSTNETGIFRGSSGLWALRVLTRYYYGRTGDIPVAR